MKRLALLAGAGVLVTLSAGFTESGRWRLTVLERKHQGLLPHMDWAETLRGLQLCAWGDCHRRLVLGGVSLVRVDRDAPCPALWDTPLGPMWGRLEDQTYLQYYSGKWPMLAREPERYPQVKHGDVVVEAGAWIGSFTRFALSRGASRVVAVEPEPVNADCFRKTFHEEIREGRVVLVERALWDRDTSVRLTNPSPERGGESTIVSKAGEIEVPATTLDAVIDELALDRVDFLNVDVEGSERQMIAGAERTLRRFRPQVSLCTHHLPGDEEYLPGAVLAVLPDYRFVNAGLRGHFFAPERDPLYLASTVETRIEP